MNPKSPSVPQGRVTVSGIVIKLHEEKNEWSTSTNWRMCVRLPNGAHVWSSVPRHANTAVGAEISFTATFVPAHYAPGIANGTYPKLAAHPAAAPQSALVLV